MKNIKEVFRFGALLSLFLWPIACTQTISIPSSPNLQATATPTTTPNLTPTSTPTVTIPMGLWVGGSFSRSYSDMSLLGIGTFSPVTILFSLSINHTAETTDAVTLTTPIEGAIAVPYWQNVTLGGVPVAQYASAAMFTYVPNATYSMSVSSSLGTVTSSISAPGGMTFNSNAASVTAAYPGIYDFGIISSYPSLTTVYSSYPGPSVGSPFTFPVTAYSSPGTFYNSYAAAATVTSFSGPAAVGSILAASDASTKLVAR